jgi:hypothetical protein
MNAQQQESLTRVLRHHQNPEVKKVIQLSSEGRYTETEKIYRNLKEMKSIDALDLLVFAASRYKNQDVIDWEWISNEYTLNLLQNYVGESTTSDEELFRKGIINYAMGILLGNQNALANSYAQLQPLAVKGWEETILPVTDILYEMHINQYEPLKTDEILPTIIQGVRYPTSADNVIKQLASGLENPYATVAGTKEKLIQERKLLFTKAFLEQLVAEKDESILYVFHSLMERSTLEPGFGSYKIQYREVYTKNLESIIDKLISKYPVESLSLQQLYLTRKMIYDSPTGSSQLAQKIVSLHKSKEEAFTFIEEFLKAIPYNAGLETLARSDKKWTEVFKKELLTWNTEHLPLILRHTDLYIPYLKSNKVEVPELLKSLDFQNYVTQSLYEDVNEFTFNPKFLPEIIYDMYNKVHQIRSLPAYQKDTELKYLEAQYLMLFHEYHAKLNKIHSARILSFNSTFDHWTSAEVKNFPKDRAVNFVRSYSKTLSESGRFVGSMEYDTVLSEIDKFIKRFDLK